MSKNLSPKSLVVPPARAWEMIDCGNDFGYKLIARGELESFLQGRLRKITVASINKYIERRIAASAGKGGRCAQPLSNPPRPRTPPAPRPARPGAHSQRPPQHSPPPPPRHKPP